MNKTVFVYSLKRYFDWQQAIIGGFAIICFGIIIGVMWGSSVGFMGEMSRWLLFGPTIPLVVASIAIMPKVANSQQRKDGEYLSLLFSRPVSRTSYIVSKWLSASVFVLAVIMILALISTVSACVAQLLFAGHLFVRPLIDGYGLADAALNSLSFSALFVMFAACPGRIRLFISSAVIGILFAMMFSVGLNIIASGISVVETSKVMGTLMSIFGSLFRVSVDSYHIIYAAESPLSAILIYISNVVLYLTVASLALCHREFFYAND